MCPRKQAHFALWDVDSGSVNVQPVHKVLRIGTPPKCCCKRRGKCLYLYYTNQQTRYNTPLRTLCRATKGRRSGGQGLLIGSDLYPVFLRGQLLPPGKLCFCRRGGCRRAFPRSFCRILSKVRRVRRKSAVWRLHSFGVFFQFVR